MASYEKVANLVSKVRNARYGEMVNYLETLIDSGDWRDFSTPAGTRFQFRECEFDYFLLAMEVTRRLSGTPTCTPTMWMDCWPSSCGWPTSPVAARLQKAPVGHGSRWPTSWRASHRGRLTGFAPRRKTPGVGS